ncbi:MAG: serine/threonine protein kinase [Deltaproteobacteria bacterium]|nr:MAG: serine/threonine protein kinase [Deltaproteobacteria bacterium]
MDTTSVWNVTNTFKERRESTCRATRGCESIKSVDTFPRIGRAIVSNSSDQWTSIPPASEQHPAKPLSPRSATPPSSTEGETHEYGSPLGAPMFTENEELAATLEGPPVPPLPPSPESKAIEKQNLLDVRRHSAQELMLKHTPQSIRSVTDRNPLDDLINETIAHNSSLSPAGSQPLTPPTGWDQTVAHSLDNSLSAVPEEPTAEDMEDSALSQTLPSKPPPPESVQSTLKVAPLSETQKFTTRQTTGVRRYKDGMYASYSGDRYEADSGTFNSVIELPYRSHEVLKRMGNYDLLEKLGEGAMGIVYRAYSVSLCRMCAIKILKMNEQVTEASIVRFQNEAMLAARLRHPNIVSVFDSGEQDGQFFFVMEYVKGQTFTDLIKEGTEESLWRGVQVLTKVARALEYAHQFGIVHRDLKPDNILVDADDEPYITDFGIAKGMDLDLGLTQAESMMGTPYYMSPEQANGEIKSVGPQSDIYALGATLYHLLTGTPPFMGESLFQLIFQLLNKEPISPRVRAAKETGRTIPVDLDTICLKCLEKEVPRRYQTAAELADDMQAFLDDRPIQARPIGTVERLQKLLRRNRKAFVGVALVASVLLLMAVSFGAVLMYNMEQQSQSLRRLDRKSAIQQASTLERAIRSNMLEGRADIVRALVGKLRKDRSIEAIEVVRPDRSLAYSDLRTRHAVEKRLSDPKVMAWIQKKYPKIVPKVGELKRVAFVNMDNSPHKEQARFKAFPKVWKQVAEDAKVKTRLTREKDIPMLTVLWPIRNTKECQACHGSSRGTNAYSKRKAQNYVRAVLVVKRSQQLLEYQINANRWATLGIGATTSFVVLFFLLIFGKLFNIGLGKRTFGNSSEEEGLS